MNVLIVDNDYGYLQSMKKQLTVYCSNVEIEKSPVNALYRIQNGNFDVVIIDYYMDEMNGLELLKKLRKYLIPFLFLSVLMLMIFILKRKLLLMVYMHFILKHQ